MMRYSIYIIVALLIDGLQMATSLLGALSIVGIALGFALSAVIGIVMGAGLVSLLAFNGLFYPKYLWIGGFELIPGLNVLPSWTAFTVRCIMKKSSEEKGLLGAVAKVASGGVASPTGILNVAGSVMNNSQNAGVSPNRNQQAPLPSQEAGTQPEQEQQERPATLQLSKNIGADIKPPRAANDTLIRGDQAYAA